MAYNMLSVFHTIDCKYNPKPGFWQPLGPQLPECLVSSTIFGGVLRIRREDGSFKSRKFLLTSSYLYYLSKWNIPRAKSQINWKTVQAFTETLQQQTLFGFKIGDNNDHDFYVKDSKELEQWLDHFYRVSILSSFDEDYIILKQLETGKASNINLCVTSGGAKECVSKTFPKELLIKEPKILNEIINEISALRLCNHPNIIKLHKVYETQSHVHLIFEYYPQGNLKQMVEKHKNLTETQVLKLIQGILEVVKYLHSINIVHRDIKLENIMMTSKTKFEFKLIDFGLACSQSCGLVQKCGSPGFIAPEILRGDSYNFKADIFSTGVIMYILLADRMPLTGKNVNEILENNLKCEIDFGKTRLKKNSKGCIKLLKKLLEVNPTFRCSAGEALEHPCIKSLEEVEFTSTTAGCYSLPMPSLYISNCKNDFKRLAFRKVSNPSRFLRNHGSRPISIVNNCNVSTLVA